MTRSATSRAAAPGAIRTPSRAAAIIGVVRAARDLDLVPDRAPRTSTGAGTRAHIGADLVTDDALARLAPVLHAHINPYGRYSFDLTAVPALGHLRPLNTIAAREDSDVPTTPIPLNRD